jgi:hypothetical protein
MGAGAIEKLKKGLGGRCTDEYRRAIALNPTPRIFFIEAMSPMNICGLYSSVAWLH